MPSYLHTHLRAHQMLDNAFELATKRTGPLIQYALRIINGSCTYMIGSEVLLINTNIILFLR